MLIKVSHPHPIKPSEITPEARRALRGAGYGFGSLWVPLCSPPSTLAKVDLNRNALTAVFKVCCYASGMGPGGDSLGIGHDAIWLTDYHAGTISRLELKNALGGCHPPSRQ